jgi:hypothetical protein
VVLNGRLPTYKFFATPHPRGAKPRDTTDLTSDRPRRPGGQYERGAGLTFLGECARQARDKRAKTGHSDANHTTLPTGRNTRPAVSQYYTAAAAGCNTVRTHFWDNSAGGRLSSAPPIR